MMTTRVSWATRSGPGVTMSTHSWKTPRNTSKQVRRFRSRLKKLISTSSDSSPNVLQQSAHRCTNQGAPEGRDRRLHSATAERISWRHDRAEGVRVSTAVSAGLRHYFGSHCRFTHSHMTDIGLQKCVMGWCYGTLYICTVDSVWGIGKERPHNTCTHAYTCAFLVLIVNLTAICVRVLCVTLILLLGCETITIPAIMPPSPSHDDLFQISTQQYTRGEG